MSNSKSKPPIDSKSIASDKNSIALSFMDLKISPEKGSVDCHQNGKSTSTARSRSFLHCLGRRLGRHFPQNQHHHQHQHQQQQQQQHNYQHRQQRCQNIYNSEEDIHSSSTDSFSLSYERCSSALTPNCHMIASSIDLTGEERSSGTSSASSGYSRNSSNAVYSNDANDIWSKQRNNGRRHFFVKTTATTKYRRPVSALGHFSTDEYSNNSLDDENEADNDGDGEDDDEDEDDYNKNSLGNEKSLKQKNITNNKNKNNNSNGNGNGNRNGNGNGKSIMMVKNKKEQKKNSVIKISKSNSSSNSNSKHSCSVTPPSRSRSISPCSIAKGLNISRISITSSVCRMFHHFTTSSSSSSSTATSTSTSTRSQSCSSTPLRNNNTNNRSKNSNNKSTKTSTLKATSNKPKEKKQQSILRPPVHYVYMKGMSGLYSRVPRYTVQCCPYTMHQSA